MDGEGAGVDVADRVDQADDASGTAQVEAGERCTVRGEVEEGVSGQHVVAVGQQPVVQLTLLCRGRVQVVPDVGSAAGGTQPGQTELGAVTIGEGLEPVQLGDVVAGADHGDLEGSHACGGEVLHRPQRRRVRTGAAYRVVDVGGRAVEGDLDVHVVVGGEPASRLGRDADAVGGELHADVVGGGVVEEFPEVGADGGFSAADVDVEDLHGLQLVDDRLGFGGAQLARVAAAGAGEAVGAGQVAGIGQFPGEADRRVESGLEEVDQPCGAGCGGHGVLPTSICDSASAANARP